MRFNEKEMAAIAQKKGRMEGRLQHRPPPGTFRDVAFRERYFKLVNNMLFYFRLNEFGQIDSKEPVGLIVLENYSVRVESDSDLSFAFGILFLDEPDRKHIFTTRSDEDVAMWVDAIRQASCQHWKHKLLCMQSSMAALKEAKEKEMSDKLDQQKVLGNINDLSLLDFTQRPSPSPQRQRRNPFLPPPTDSATGSTLLQPPMVPPRPRTNSPNLNSRAQNVNNNNNAQSSNPGDLIKF